MGRLEASNVLFVANGCFLKRFVLRPPSRWSHDRTPWIEWILWWKVRHHETSGSFSWELISVWIWSRANVGQTKTTHLSTSAVAPCRLQEGNVLRDFCSQTHQELTQQLGHTRPIVMFPIAMIFIEIHAPFSWHAIKKNVEKHVGQL